MDSLQNLANSVAGRRPKPPSLRVLVADSDPVSSSITVRLLERHGHEVITADGGQAALGKASHKRFDLVLLDVDAPDGDGSSYAAKIREAGIENGVRTAIWGLTIESGGRSRIVRAAQAFDLVLSKPVESSALAEALNRILPR